MRAASRRSVVTSFPLRPIVLAFVLALASPAIASHYYLRDMDAFGSEAVEAFLGAGIEDTEQLLRRVALPEDRAKLSGYTGIPASDLVEIARMCEMIQIRGVGPRAARLLFAAGVRDIGDLAARNPDELLPLLVAANAGSRFTNVDPTLRDVTEWVNRAAEAPLRVTY